MIKSKDKVEIEETNILFCLGATDVLAFIARSLFNDGDHITLDTPVYPVIVNDLGSRAKMQFHFKEIS